jgi:Bax protein
MSTPQPHGHRIAVAAVAVLVAAGAALAAFDPGGVSIADRPPNAAGSDGAPDQPIEVASLDVRLPQKSLDYDLDTVAEGLRPVPRVFFESIPASLERTREVDERKALFFKSVLPLVLQVNQDILRDRRKLIDLRARRDDGEALSAAERLWLIVMAERYGLDAGEDHGPVDLDALVRRVDVVPPSLALAQAAKESGWGRSRFAQDGNALFGQWTWSGPGLVPEDRQDGKSHKVRAFGDLLASVRAYVRNLNSHRAYREFRSMRADMRAKGRPIDGRALASTLHRYSELGHEYTERLQKMIDFNDLSRLDDAELARPTDATS